MRELKFRAWWQDEGLMVRSVNLSRFFDAHRFGDCPIMQYTGLNDKNGTEIYEGDVIRSTDPFMGDQPLEILWSKTLAAWAFNDTVPLTKEKITDPLHCVFEDDEYIVIGNIHENPDLLDTPTE